MMVSASVRWKSDGSPADVQRTQNSGQSNHFLLLSSLSGLSLDFAWTCSRIQSCPTDSDGLLTDCPLSPSEMAGSDESPLDKQWECKCRGEASHATVDNLCCLSDLSTPQLYRQLTVTTIIQPKKLRWCTDASLCFHHSILRICKARSELQETKIILVIPIVCRQLQWILVLLQDMNYNRIYETGIAKVYLDGGEEASGSPALVNIH
ncbi:uncharacterized protein LACBIDRAFT_334437 [Laccaria bicolor S238N-H82]|uniref:Predicted protein n=1 Tax=Laccaria bicolor (strain S238N-H82 / ATCC MYA-4686) TaxID=486041 RepID=B0DZ76_LACBS|nr:uncharacterized protein LACBIDRAFT_334437 [Laccaria bicolor S238N-H82]EDR00190.1 predicted protein [Laccaria bicolor S238N-H82]|eukprot:XP_001889247.1 predicted protein [Laccaria bicolor S238N-H82]